MSGYILRRNHWGENATKHVLAGISDSVEGVLIINKDAETIPVADWCIRWATTSSVPGNPKVINKAEAMHRTTNKAGFRKLLADNNLASKTTVNKYPTNDMYPVIIRPWTHGKSEDLYVCSCEQETVKAIKEIQKLDGDGSYYCSEFIDKDHEHRVFVVSGRVVSVREKIPADKNAASWGCVGAGSFEYVKWSKWPLEAVRKSCAAMELSGLDFGAVDVIMMGTEAYILEINTGPDISEYDGWQLGVAIAHILKTNDRKFIAPGTAANWKSYIHPAISDTATLGSEE